MLGPETLLLFAIDGTLPGGMPPAHRQAICEAARQVFDLSLAPDQMTMTAGRTDTAIVCRALEQAGLNRFQITPVLPAFFAAMETTSTRLRLPDLRPYLLPAVAETLAWLDQRGAALGLITGNHDLHRLVETQRGRHSSLFFSVARLAKKPKRDALPALAAARAQTCFGRAFRPEATLVTGNTPFDIACGAACDFRTIAVATGLAHTFDDPDGHRPEFLLREPPRTSQPCQGRRCLDEYVRLIHPSPLPEPFT